MFYLSFDTGKVNLFRKYHLILEGEIRRDGLLLSRFQLF